MAFTQPLKVNSPPLFAQVAVAMPTKARSHLSSHLDALTSFVEEHEAAL